MKMLNYGLFMLIITTNLLFVESHVAYEINSESDSLKFNAFIDNMDNSQDNNYESQNNETSKDSENPEETLSSTIATPPPHDEFTVIHVAEHHKKEPSKVKDFPLSEFHKEESSTIPSENDHQPATVESTSTISQRENAIETKTMKTERQSTAREQKENFSTAKNSEHEKIHQNETFSTKINKTSTIKPKPTPSNATSLKMNFVIFLITFFACFFMS